MNGFRVDDDEADDVCSGELLATSVVASTEFDSRPVVLIELSEENTFRVDDDEASDVCSGELFATSDVMASAEVDSRPVVLIAVMSADAAVHVAVRSSVFAAESALLEYVVDCVGEVDVATPVICELSAPVDRDAEVCG